MGDAFPRGPEAVTAEWLSKNVGGTVDSFDIEQIGIGVGLLGRLYRLKLNGDGVPDSVIAKFPTLDDGARMNVVEPLQLLLEGSALLQARRQSSRPSRHPRRTSPSTTPSRETSHCSSKT